MNRSLYTAVVALMLLTSCSDSIDIKVISFNIRYDNPADGNNSWSNRKEMVVGYLAESGSDIFGLQEVLWHQYSYIDSTLQGYNSIVAGRDDGLKEGESTPVFYSNRRFDLLDYNTFWLSETPDIPGSKGWGAVLPRVVTWVKLYDRNSKNEFYFFNTHFSHMSDSARVMSSGILAKEIFNIAGDNFFVLSGDFNMLPGSKAYRALVNDDSFMTDSYLASSDLPVGPENTFNGFSDSEGSSRIDYIFVKPGASVKSYSTFEGRSGSLFISDHWPVETMVTWKF